MSNESRESPVYLHDGDDPEMGQAIEQARRTFRFFWRELAWERRRIIPGLDLACVKVAFSDPPGSEQREGPSVEQMWINEVDFDGRTISGTLLNSPNWLTSVKEGDHVEIPAGELTDWMYAIQGKVYGAYTVNLLRARMARGERAQHDAAWGLDFGDPNAIRLIPPDFLGEKPKGFFGRLFSGPEPPQNAEQLASLEHPMALNMTASLENHVKQNPTSVSETDDRGFTLLHQLALAGAAQGVSVLLRHGADPRAVTSNGLTPLQLAQSLGWQNVVAILQAQAANQR